MMEEIVSMERENFSAEREKRMNAESIANQSGQMVKDLINLEPCTTLQVSFHRLSLKTGLEAGQIKRLYYNEWRVIPAYIWEQLKSAHRRLIDRALRNMEHRQNMMHQQMQAFDDLLKEDEERQHALSKIHRIQGL